MEQNEKPQKVFVYLEYKRLRLGGAFSSYRNQVKILTRLGIPFTEHWNETATILQCNSPWLFSLYHILKAKRRQMRSIVWAHSTAEDVAGFFRIKILERAAIFFLKPYFTYLYSLADTVLCPTPYTRRLLIAYGLPPEKLQVLSNGVDTDRFYADEAMRARARKEFGLTKTTVGCVGIVIPRKGVDTFLRLASRRADVDFLWIGTRLNPLLVKPLPENLPRNARFTGHITDIVEGFNALDIFLFPSHEENQGMAILEAAAVGLPIIVRDIPAYEGWLKHEHNCLKAKTEEEFNIHLQRLIENSNLRARLGERARELAKSESLETLTLKYKELYAL